MGFPARLRRGPGGEVAYFDGVNEPVVLPPGTGVGSIMGTVGVAVTQLDATDYDAITAFFTGVADARRIALAEAVVEALGA